MAILTSYWYIDIVTLLVFFVSLLLAYVSYQMKYFERKKIPYKQPTFFIGNIGSTLLQKESFSELTLSMYNYFKKQKLSFGGLYFLFEPTFMPLDPAIVKSMLQSDFQHFHDRGVYFNEKDDPLSAHLFSIEGKKWRNIRMKLTPTFTSGKLKMMFQTLVDCSKQFIVEMDKHAGKESVNIKNYLCRFTTDIIGSCAFGIECNSLKDPNVDFNKYGQSVFEAGVIEGMKGLFGFAAPNLARALRLCLNKPDVSRFFLKVIGDTVDYREKGNIYRKDFMHLLLQLKNRGQVSGDDDRDIISKQQKEEADSEERLTFNELAAQAFVFFIAGFETSSTTMTFCLYELASNADIQKRTRDEINSVLERHNQQLTYEAMLEMNYLEKVINETLRKYPPLPILNRQCTVDYLIPNTDIVLEKGRKVIIPVLGLHHDEDYYPEPEKFDPERFSEENKCTRPPFTFLPFGEGPRNCIGMRFGMMQVKVGITVLLKNYEFSVSPKTQTPLKMDPKSFIMSTQGAMWLDYKKIM